MDADMKVFFEKKKKTLHERLTFLAEQQGLTLYQVEKELGISQNTLSKCDTKSTQWEYLYLVADFFHVSIDYLTTRTDVPYMESKKLSPSAQILMHAAESMNLSKDSALMLVEFSEWLRNNKDKIS